MSFQYGAMESSELVHKYGIGNNILPSRITFSPQSPTLAIFRIPFLSSMATILLGVRQRKVKVNKCVCEDALNENDNYSEDLLNKMMNLHRSRTCRRGSSMSFSYQNLRIVVHLLYR